MMRKERYRVSTTVKDAEKYLAAHLMADTEFAITVQGFTTTGSGPPSCKIAKTNNIPNVTGMFILSLKITIFNTVPSTLFSYQSRFWSYIKSLTTTVTNPLIWFTNFRANQKSNRLINTQFKGILFIFRLTNYNLLVLRFLNNSAEKHYCVSCELAHNWGHLDTAWSKRGSDVIRSRILFIHQLQLYARSG